ncbi:MAG: hypothetical protein AAGI09_11980 [Pseudomonadota bacterium]
MQTVKPNPTLFTPDDIEGVEARLEEAKIPLALLYREGAIAQTTWMRWRAGAVFPNYKSAARVTKAINRLLPGSYCVTDTPQEDAA